MKLIHNEIKVSMNSTLKETDLFKVYQTSDLANFNIHETPQLFHLLSLRDALYSEEFRELMQRITQCDTLTDQTDCSVNAYVNGSHLLCHDDVIGTRCVSYIIYIPDPEEEWNVNDGGALELYPVDEESLIPLVEPTVQILPKFNRMAFFTVQPGRSYHSVQEVYADGKPRISISGWFHAKTPPKDAEKHSSLAQLLAESQNEQVNMQFKSLPSVESGCEDENDDQNQMVAYLSEWINPVYLDRTNLKQIQQQFIDKSFIELRDFLKAELAEKLQKQFRKRDQTDQLGYNQVPKYSAGLENELWKAKGPPHMQRFLEMDSAGVLRGGGRDAEYDDLMLAKISEELFVSKLFVKWLRFATGVEPIEGRAEVRRFRPGLDYTVAHVGGITKEMRLDVTLVFVEGGQQAEDWWDDGEVGGFECYIEQDEESEMEASAIYREDEDDGPLVTLTPSFNSLSLVCRDEGVLRFVKYIAAAAPSSRWDISAEYKFQSCPTDDERENDDGKDKETNA